MSGITLTIDGKQAGGKQGDTVLDVCQANGVVLPTLCHYKGLTDVGACRLCLVEVEKERNLVPACTYPAREGQVVSTGTERLQKYRRMILELLFTERNHLCAYCAASGDCELQSLAYQYQMDNTRYQYSWPNQVVDSSHSSLVLDHNRCILCGRCIRTCDEITGAHALDFGKRGWKTNVYADINQPLGESSCISCGGCFQACPTGAIFSKGSAYRGRPEECVEVESTCPVCGIGCDIKALTKNNRIVRIDSPDITAPRGLLCHKGRFGPLNSSGDRVKTPLKRNSRGQLVACSYEDAFHTIVRRMKGSPAVAGLTTGNTSLEALEEFAKLMRETLGSKLVDTLDGDDYRTVTRGISEFDKKSGVEIEGMLEDILAAGSILVVGANPLSSHPVAGSYILRAAAKNGVPLVVLDSLRNPYSFRARVWLKPTQGKEAQVVKALGNAILRHGIQPCPSNAAGLATEFLTAGVTSTETELGLDPNDILKAAEILAGTRDCLIVYGQEVLKSQSPRNVSMLLLLSALLNRDNNRPKVISLKRYGNSRGAWELKLGSPRKSILSECSGGKVRNLLLLLADDTASPTEIAQSLTKVEFVAAVASFVSAVTSRADVVLPSPTWTEAQGTYCTLDGIRKTMKPIIAADHVMSNVDVLKAIGKHLTAARLKE